MAVQNYPGFQSPTAAHLIMVVNGAFFVISAILHLGVQLGPWSEPRLAPATLVEMICALALAAGALAPRYAPRAAAAAPIAANLIALVGLTLEAIAQALDAGLRTASNDIFHLLLALLTLAALWLLVSRTRLWRERRSK